jgi:hypothetical protein
VSAKISKQSDVEEATPCEMFRLMSSPFNHEDADAEHTGALRKLRREMY